jgi:hypothetical protein
MLMNCDLEYNDDKERDDSPPLLLPQPEGPMDPTMITSIIAIAPGSPLGKYCRSVLDHDLK